MSRRPDVTTLLPHRPPILLVESVVEERDDGVVCRGRVPEGGPLARGGVAPVVLALELAAQTAAVHAALASRRDGAPGADPSASPMSARGEPAIGLLASIGDACFAVPELPAGAPLLASVTAAGSMPPLTLYRVRVVAEDDGRGLLTARLGVYLRKT